MTSRVPGYTTKELSRRTWPDFERLFSQGNGWDFCWCMFFQRGRQLSRKEFRTRAEQGVRNHQDKKELIEKIRSHGILVYANGEPVGWCQYGPRNELPCVENSRKNLRLAAEEPGERLWRITCFVTDKKHRRRGVASAALRAALEAIRKKGGGLVEACPIAHWHADPWTPAGSVFVQGVGPVAAVRGTFGNVSTQGTVSMFEREGFKAVAVVSGGTHVLMQRIV
jgi:ribosomal protein S18 acetylase RimI-like enzyme